MHVPYYFLNVQCWENMERKKMFLSKSHGQRSLAGYSPWGHKRVGCDLATKTTTMKTTLAVLVFINLLLGSWLLRYCSSPIPGSLQITLFLFYYFMFLAVLHSMPNLSSLTRVWTCAPGSRILTLNLNHWISREVPQITLLIQINFHFI